MDRPEFVGTIGEKLQEARRKRGKTLKEVENVLRIRSSYLEAMEKDNFDKLPGLAYAKAFLRSYADYLGLNSEELVRELEKIYAGREAPSIFFDESKKVSPLERRNKRWLWLALSIAFLILALVIFQPFTSREKVSKTSTPEKESVKETFSVETTPSDNATQTSPASESTSSEIVATSTVPLENRGEKLKLTVKVTGEKCWMRVMTDGEKVFEDILISGEEKTWEATESITVRVGSPKAVELRLNGELIEVPPGTGVFEKTFRKEG